MAPNSVPEAEAQITDENEERFRGRFARMDANGDDVMRRGEYTIYRVATFNAMDNN